MRSHPFSKFFFALLSALLLSAFHPVIAQEESEAPAAEEEVKGITLGEAAALIARKLGLSGATDTQADSIRKLKARGVLEDGWEDPSLLLEPGQFARMLVQALGLEEELSEAEINGDSDQPYIDLLISKYGVDVSTLGGANNAPGSSGVGGGSLGVATDPLKTGQPDTDPHSGEINPITRKDVNDTLDAIAGGSGSGSGSGSGGGQSNMTPSAP